MSNEDMDIGNILEALNDKADRDLSNLALEGGGGKFNDAGDICCSLRNTKDGWLLCDGSSYPVSQYQQLYTVIGNKFGGDETNFNVPDLVGCTLSKSFKIEADDAGGNVSSLGFTRCDNGASLFMTCGQRGYAAGGMFMMAQPNVGPYDGQAWVRYASGLKVVNNVSIDVNYFIKY